MVLLLVLTMRIIHFFRAPMQDSVEDLISYLEARGVKPPYRDVHVGPDGTIRGSGAVVEEKRE